MLKAAADEKKAIAETDLAETAKELADAKAVPRLDLSVLSYFESL